ncbi:MAG: NTP transferase domain-containing protein [Deltaproteobacteria bacterium]|nr:NTP transferase domain-containing protein [Deltaproteobacteria bacterium]
MNVRTGMILAAGYGTRMRPLTDHLAKPLLPAGARTLLERSLGWMAAAGMSRVVVNLHHLADQVRAFAEAVRPPDLELCFSREPEILGSGGGIGRAAEAFFPQEDVLVVNGDLLFEQDPLPLLEAHGARGAAATCLVIPAAREPSLASVTLGEDGRVLEVTREGAAPSHPGFRGIFAGIHVLSPELHRRLPRDRFASVIDAGYRPCMAEGRVFGVPGHGPWWDLGTPARYEAALREFFFRGLPA